jgi:serine/threonine protein kinase
MLTEVWPSSREFVEAIQNPILCFSDPVLKAASPALDRLGMPLVAAGQFAYVFKLNLPNASGAQAVRCFRGYLGDRAQRYEAINHHLDAVSVSTLASFEYDEEGLLVQGRKYPILAMEWIDGNALDVYISKVISNPESLRVVAEQWMETVYALRKTNIAHGDLQHGNIIVQHDGLIRLVDLDGMFVPCMRGWRASELGHRHYQHPRRTPQLFNENLDNFSALVIYLSLIATAEQPELWQDYHDENLILSKTDFLDPSTSKLFKKLRKLTVQTQRLTRVLEDACERGPLDCPDLQTIVAPPSKLPAWMRHRTPIVVQTSTREVVKPNSITDKRVSETSKEPREQSPIVIGTPTTSTQALTSSSAQIGFLTTAARNGLTFAFIGVLFIWLWLPLARAVLQSWGMDSWNASTMSILIFLVACAVAGYVQAVRGAMPVVILPKGMPATRRPQSGLSHSLSKASYVGHRINRVYHYQSCEWARKISFRNRMPLGSSVDATTRGFRPCKVCRP